MYLANQKSVWDSFITAKESNLYLCEGQKGLLNDLLPVQTVLAVKIWLKLAQLAIGVWWTCDFLMCRIINQAGGFVMITRHFGRC